MPVEHSIQKIAIVVPDVYTYDISGGGVPEYRFDWSTIGSRNLAMATRTELGTHVFEGILAENDTGAFSMDTITARVKHVATALQKRLYGKNAFITEIDSFTYSTGPLHTLCTRYNADAVMFLFGIDEHFSDQRKSILKTEAALKTARSTFFSTLSLLLVGSAQFRKYEVPPERTWLYCLVANAEGDIIWFKQYAEADDTDMCKTGDIEKVVKEVLSGFNRKKQKTL